MRRTWIVLLAGFLATSCTLEPKREHLLEFIFNRASEKTAPQLFSPSIPGGEPQLVAAGDSLSDFECLGVNVVGPGIGPAFPVPMPDLFQLMENNGSCSYPGISSASFSAYANDLNLALTVPAGRRLIQVVGLKNSAHCTTPIFQRGAVGSPEAYEVGRAVVDVFSDIQVAIANTYDSTKPRRMDCGSGCKLASFATEPMNRGMFLTSTGMAWQKMILGSPGYLTKVRLLLGDSTVAGLGVKVQLWSSDGAGEPNAIVDAVRGEATATVPLNTRQWVDFDFGAPGDYHQFAAGTYWLRVEVTTASHRVRWYGGKFTGTPPAQNGVFGSRKDVAIGPISVPVSIATGVSTTCALGSAGDVRCWGSGSPNVRGETSYASANKPVPGAPINFGAGLHAVAITMGEAHGCALLNDSTVKCWGSNSYGQIGDNSTSFRDTPVHVKTSSGATVFSGVAEIQAGAEFTCARTTAGAVYCWGSDGSGQLGNGAGSGAIEVPSTPVVSNAKKLAVGYRHVCYVDTSDDLHCWGDNQYGQVGLSNVTTSYHTPQAVSGMTNVTLAAAGLGHTCAVNSGSLYCWGLDTSGELGDGTAGGARDTPGVVSLAGVYELTAGYGHTCAAITDGGARSLQCWGRNDNGQVGDNTYTDAPSPVEVKRPDGSLKLQSVNLLARGPSAYHTCALVGPGDPLCWGKNSAQQLGIGESGLSAKKLPTEAALFRSFAYELRDCTNSQ